MRALYQRLTAALAVTLAVALAASAGAHTQSAGSLRVTHPWVTPAETGASATAHPTLTNQGGTELAIVGASSPVAQRTSLILDGQDVSELGVPAGATLGADRVAIRLQDLTTDLPEGKGAPLTLSLAGGASVELTLAIGESTMEPEQMVE